MTTHYTIRKGIKFTYYRCVNAMKRGKAACPVGQISSVDVEAIGVSLLRMLSRDEKLLKAVVEKAVRQDHTDEDQLKKQRKDLIGRRAEEKKRADGLLVALEMGNATDVKMLVDRIRERQEMIKHFDEQLRLLDIQIQSIPPAAVDVEAISCTYLYFWQIWRELQTEERVRAIRAIVREFRIYATDGNQIRLEIELITNIKTNTPTCDGGSAESVRNSLSNGSA
jgi:hypothetical protein